jgi:hypothetical protein
MVDIPRLQRIVPITEADGTPTQAFHVWWDRVAKNIEDAITDLSSQVAAIAAAQAAATAAQVAATAAQATADVAKRNDKISASLLTPTSILSATDIGGGAGATIIIANHVRKYGDASTLSITGGTVTPLAYSTVYAIYYDDTTTSVTNPTFLATATLADGQYNAAPGRHYCGQITTPASGAGGTSGDGPRGTGGGGPYS